MAMEYLVKDQPLELKYEPGKGAWTYHIQIPHTAHLVGKWGSLKVSGFIDGHEIDSINLFSIKGQDKLISINEKIRKAIHKTGGDPVNLTLFLVPTKERLTEREILETFEDSGVLKAFNKLSDEERTEIIGKIIAIKSDDHQVRAIVKYTDRLSRHPD